MCASIAPYLPQITTLNLGSNQKQLPWASVLTAVSNTLTRFTTTHVLTDELVGCLCEHAPGLVHLGCSKSGYATSLSDKHAEATWGVRKLCYEGRLSAEWLVKLPQSLDGLLITSKGGEQCCLDIGYIREVRKHTQQGHEQYKQQHLNTCHTALA